MRNIRIAGRVNNTLRKDSFPAGLALDNDPCDSITVHDGSNKHSVKHGRDSRLEDEVIGHCFKSLTIDGMALGLRFGYRGARCLGTLFKFNTNPLTIDGLLVSIPGETFNTDGGDVAAKTAISFQQSDADTGASRSNRSRQSSRSTANDQDISGVDYR